MGVSQQTCVSNAEVGSSSGGMAGGGIIAFAGGDAPPFEFLMSGNQEVRTPKQNPRPQGDRGTSLAADVESVAGGVWLPNLAGPSQSLIWLR